MTRKKLHQHTRKLGDQPMRTKHKGRVLRAIRIGQGLPSLPEMENELIDMANVLLGRDEAPTGGLMSLMETADAYYARAAEMTMLLQAGERKGTITRGSAHYKFRTGELRTFMELAKRAADLGSRRVTEEQLQLEREALGRESR